MSDKIPLRPSTSGHGFVFWMLIVLGLIGFAPCVLLPEWRQYESLARAEQVEAYRLGQLESVVQREQSAFEAIRDDPAVLARLAQRDLGFRYAEEYAVVVAAVGDGSRPARSAGVPVANLLRSGLDWTPDETFVLEPVRPPAFLGRAVAVLPALDYDAVFCDDDTRATVMGMSLGLIAFAFVVFGGSVRRGQLH